jgi:HK97 family phage major capsid protein
MRTKKRVLVAETLEQAGIDLLREHFDVDVRERTDEAELARIIGDPTVYQHTENTDDIVESDIDLEPVTANPKMLAALIPLTQEVVSDSPNLNAALNMAIAAAFGAKLDALSLATILADTDIPTSAAGQDPALWQKCLEAVSAAMTANQPLPSSMITSTADFIARAAQLASTAGSWLGKPPVLSGMSEHPTTGVTAGTAIYGGFAQAFALAMRQELRLEVIRWKNPGKATHLLVAHMRADGVVLQPKRLFIQQKTVA